MRGVRYNSNTMNHKNKYHMILKSRFDVDGWIILMDGLLSARANNCDYDYKPQKQIVLPLLLNGINAH